MPLSETFRRPSTSKGPYFINQVSDSSTFGYYILYESLRSQLIGVVTPEGIHKLMIDMSQWYVRHIKIKHYGACPGLLSIVPILLAVACIGVSRVEAGLDMKAVHDVLGNEYEVIKQVPGRPWVEEQHRYEKDGLMISCNFVARRCLWIDYWSRGNILEEDFMFAELERLFPGVTWTAMEQSGKLKRWLNEQDDRVTLRSTGFTVHMNEYIRNVLSRRAQWQF